MKRFFILIASIIFFTSVSSFSETVSFNIAKGWNLKSITLDSVSVKNFENYNVTLWKWSGDNWEIWSSNDTIKDIVKNYGIKSFENISSGEGFWIDSKEEAGISLKGELPTDKNISYHKGWNLLGLKTTESFDLNTIEKNSDILTIWVWTGKNWTIWSPYENIKSLLDKYEIKFLKNLSPYEGFWLNAATTGEIIFENNPVEEDFKIVSSANGISIFDPIVINFSLPLGFTEKDMNDFRLISVIDNSTKEFVTGKFLLSEDNKSVIFFPLNPFKTGNEYTATVSKLIKSSSGKILGSYAELSFHTDYADKPVELICDNNTIVVNESTTLGFKFNLKNSDIKSFYWKINDKIVQGINQIEPVFQSYGVNKAEIVVKDRYDRVFRASKEIFVFRNIQNAFSNMSPLPVSVGNLPIWEKYSESAFQSILKKYSSYIVSSYYAEPENTSQLIPEMGVIIVEMDKHKIKDFVNNYFEYSKAKSNLLGVAIFRGFPAILTKKTVDKDVFLEILIEDGDIDIDSYFNGGKVRVKNTGLNHIPTVIKITLRVNDNVTNAVKNKFGVNLNGFDKLMYMDFKEGKILYAFPSSVNGASVKKSGIWDTLCEYGSDIADATDTVIDAVEQVFDTITDYFSDIAVSVLSGLKDCYEKISELNVFSKLGNLKNEYSLIKDKLAGVYNKFHTDGANVVNYATDPDKLMEKLKEFLSSGTGSVKSAIDFFKDKLQDGAGAFSSVADKLIDNLDDNVDEAEDNLNEFLNGFIVLNSNMFMKFSVNSVGEIHLDVKLGTDEISLSIDTINLVLNNVANWLDSINNFPLQDLKNKIESIKNTIYTSASDWYEGKLEIDYEPATDFFDKDFRLLVTLGKYYASPELFVFKLSLKPSNPELLIKASPSVNADTYVKWEFSPYSIKPPEPSSDNNTLHELFGTIANTFTTENRPYPNGRITFHTKFLGKFDTLITGELLPVPSVAGSVKGGLKLSQYAGLGGGVELSVGGGISTPANIGLNTVSILSSLFDSAISNFSFNDFHLCPFMKNIATNVYNSPGVQSFLNNINFSLDAGVSGKIGAGAGGSEGGASANVGIGGSFSLNGNLSTVLSVLNLEQGDNCFISLNTMKSMLGGFSDLSLKKIPLLFKDNIDNYIDLPNFSEKFAQYFSAAINFSLSQEVQANLGVGADASIGESLSFGVNGEYILNALYSFLQSPDDSQSFIEKFDHPTIFPEISFALSSGGEIEFGADALLFFKQAVSMTFQVLQGKIVITSNPFLANVQSNYNLTYYPSVILSTGDANTKTATFNASIKTESGTTITSYQWKIDNVTFSSTGAYSNMFSVNNVNKNALSVNFFNKGEHFVSIGITDNLQRTSEAFYTYVVANTPPEKPVINLNEVNVNVGEHIYFASSDADNDNITFEFEISESNDFSNIVYSDNLSVKWLKIPSLTPKTYYLRIRAFDGENYSEWSNVAQFTINLPVPSISCEYKKSGDKKTLQVLVNPNTNLQNLTYIVTIWQENGSSAIGNTDTSPITFNTGDFTVFLDNQEQFPDIESNTMYYIKVKVSNGYSESPYGDSCQFVYDPQYEVNIISPEDSAEFGINDTLTFQISTPDIGENVLLSQGYYGMVEISDNQNFTNILKTVYLYYDEMGGWLEEQWKPGKDLLSGIYYFRVKIFKPSDGNDEQVGVSEKRIFFYN